LKERAAEEIEKEIGHKLSAVVATTGGYIRGQELSVMYSSADELSPRVLVEIGACTGTSSTILGSVAKKHGGMLYSIEPHPQPAWPNNMKRFGVSRFTRLIRARSPLVDSTKLPFTVIDYLLIDGDHRFESVLADYRFWAKLVRAGGRIAFHDYYSQAGVQKAVAEILRADGGGLKKLAVATGSIVKDGKDFKLGLAVFEKLRGVTVPNRSRVPQTAGEVEKEIGFKLKAIASIGPRGLRANELKTLYTTAAEVSPRVIVEIGSLHGVSSVLLGCLAKKRGGTLYCIERLLQPKLHENLRKFGVIGFAKLIEAVSPNINVEALPFATIDYLLIDGDHHLENVLADYRFWTKLVRAGGRIAFHDYYSHRGVKLALEEIQKTNELRQVTIGGVKDDLEPGLIVFEK